MSVRTWSKLVRREGTVCSLVALSVGRAEDVSDESDAL